MNTQPEQAQPIRNGNGSPINFKSAVSLGVVVVVLGAMISGAFRAGEISEKSAVTSTRADKLESALATISIAQSNENRAIAERLARMETTLSNMQLALSRLEQPDRMHQRSSSP